MKAYSESACGATGAATRAIRTGDGPCLFTVGYEKRTGPELIALLKGSQVDVLVDVRERAMSRRPDFRGKALAERCAEAGILYRRMPNLGSRDHLRDELRATGDFGKFETQFRQLAAAEMTEPLQALVEEVQHSRVALLCYERRHCECHRSIVADLVSNSIDATVVAIE